MREIEITLTDSEIKPKEIRIHANEPVRLLVINFGSVEHQFAVEGGSCGIEIDCLKPGQTRSLEHVFDEPGYFKTACADGQDNGHDLCGRLVVES
ncbi:MAG: cupredoxin domain-containing protein [Chloroflexi bacterium]|nr:cupredoxin domain-containing protein [Chloroflexota bacterium]